MCDANSVGDSPAHPTHRNIRHTLTEDPTHTKIMRGTEVSHKFILFVNDATYQLVSCYSNTVFKTKSSVYNLSVTESQKCLVLVQFLINVLYDQHQI